MARWAAFRPLQARGATLLPVALCPCSYVPVSLCPPLSRCVYRGVLLSPRTALRHLRSDWRAHQALQRQTIATAAMSPLRSRAAKSTRRSARSGRACRPLVRAPRGRATRLCPPPVPVPCSRSNTATIARCAKPWRDCVLAFRAPCSGAPIVAADVDRRALALERLRVLSVPVRPAAGPPPCSRVMPPPGPTP